jgi:hypothetical protein
MPSMSFRGLQHSYLSTCIGSGHPAIGVTTNRGLGYISETFLPHQIVDVVDPEINWPGLKFNQARIVVSQYAPGADGVDSRDDIFTILHSENVLVRKYFYPGCHRMEPYMSLYPEAYKSLKVTENISERVLCFPTGGSITGQDITQICEIIRYSLDNSEIVLKKLREEPEMHSIH